MVIEYYCIYIKICITGNVKPYASSNNFTCFGIF